MNPWIFLYFENCYWFGEHGWFFNALGNLNKRLHAKTNLAFADDIPIVGKSSLDLQRLLDIADEFCQRTGLRMNVGEYDHGL